MKKFILFFLLFFIIIGIGNSAELITGTELGVSSQSGYYNITEYDITFTYLNINSTNINISGFSSADVFTTNLGLLAIDVTEILLNATATDDNLYIFNIFNTTSNISVINLTGSLTNFTLCYNGTAAGNITMSLPDLDGDCNYGTFNTSNYNHTISQYDFPRDILNVSTCSPIRIRLDNTTISGQNYCFRVFEDESVSESNLATIIISAGSIIIGRRKKWGSISTN